MRWLTIGTLLLTVFFANVVRGEIIWTGDLNPADPTTWTIGTNGTIGNTADGTLEITNGRLRRNRSGYIGYEPLSTGQVTVDGAGSTWANSRSLRVGYWGDGTLEITGGGAVSSDFHSSIGYGSGSTGEVTVDGAGSTWNNSTHLQVGYSGTGTLEITGGAAVRSYNSWIGYYSGSPGQVTVDGAGRPGPTAATSRSATDTGETGC